VSLLFKGFHIHSIVKLSLRTSSQAPVTADHGGGRGDIRSSTTTNSTGGRQAWPGSAGAERRTGVVWGDTRQRPAANWCGSRLSRSVG